MDRDRRDVLRSLAQFALIALPYPRLLLGRAPIDAQPLAAQARRVIDAFESQLGAAAGSGSEDIGFRNRVAVVFSIDPADEVVFRIRDEHGRPAVASLLVQDAAGRVYPARAKRLAPDFSDLRHRRRPSDPRLAPQRRMVPGRRRSVLVAEGSEDQKPRA